MTEPFRPDDDLVSAVLDGEATDDERARVLADPVLRARLEEFTAVRDLVAAPVASQDDTVRAEAIRRAVAEGRRHDDVVVPLRPTRSVPGWLVAAAVVAVIVAAGFLVTRLGSNGEDYAGDDSAATADSAGGTDAASSEESGSADGSGEASDDALDEQGEVLANLGSVADDNELRSSLEQELDADFNSSGNPSPTTVVTNGQRPPLPGESERCQIRLEETDPDLAGLLLQASATYAGVPAVVYVYATTDGTPYVVVVSADGCTTLSAFAA